VNFAVFEETIRRHLTSLGYIAFAVFIALAGILDSTFNGPASIWPSLVTLLSIITGSALIGPEFSTGTLQLIVSKPVLRPVYVISRVAGVFVSVAIPAAAGATAELLTRMLAGRDLAWQRILIAFAGSLVVAFLAIATLTFLGSVTRAYFNVAIYVSVQAALTIIESALGIARIRAGAAGELLEQFHIGEIVVAIDDALFPSAPPFLTSRWVLQITATAVAFVALACLAFARREVPYGAD